MCFYYALTKKNPKALVDKGIVNPKQLSLFEDYFLVNGFNHPLMPVVSNAAPNEISHYRWGLVPDSIRSNGQAADFLKTYNTLNAKSETLHESTMYSNVILTNRCLVLCSGFFEWRDVKGKKIPYYVTLKDEELFCFAGLWSRWGDETGKQNFTFSIITVQANEFMAQIHNTKLRMPLILTPDDAKEWLRPELTTDEIRSMLKPFPSDRMKAHTIKKFLPIDSETIVDKDIIAYYNYPGVDLEMLG